MIWPLTRKPKEPDGPNPAFRLYQVGQTVMFAGKKATITHIDPWTDDENFVEHLELYYEDNQGVIHRESLNPREVMELCGNG